MTEDALSVLARAIDATGYRFTTVTPATHARVNARPSNAWARNTEDVLGWSRTFREGVLPPGIFDALRSAGVIDPYGDGWVSRVRASTLHGCLFLHSAYPTTASDAVFFGPDTYRFCDAIARHLAGGAAVRRAVDVGCGAGPGAIVVALARPGAEVVAVDINDLALRFTAVNARLAGAGRVVSRHSDLLTDVGGGFDLIVANPPYLMDAEERAYRHGGGRLGEGLSLRLVRQAVPRLTPGGTLLLYTGTAIVEGRDGFRDRVASMLDGTRDPAGDRSGDRSGDLATGHPPDPTIPDPIPDLTWTYQELDPDVFGEELVEPGYGHADRIAAVLLTVCRGPA